MPSDQPNILFLFPDQLRFDWIGGNLEIPVATPNLDRLRKQGVTFTKTVCPSPLCVPGNACFGGGIREVSGKGQ